MVCPYIRQKTIRKSSNGNVIDILEAFNSCHGKDCPFYRYAVVGPKDKFIEWCEKANKEKL